MLVFPRFIWFLPRKALSHALQHHITDCDVLHVRRRHSYCHTQTILWIALNAKLRLFSVPMALMFQYLRRRESFPFSVLHRFYFRFVRLCRLLPLIWHDGMIYVWCTSLCEKSSANVRHQHKRDRCASSCVCVCMKIIVIIIIGNVSWHRCKRSNKNNSINKSNYWLKQYWHRLRFVILWFHRLAHKHTFRPMLKAMHTKHMMMAMASAANQSHWNGK